MSKNRLPKESMDDDISPDEGEVEVPSDPVPELPTPIRKILNHKIRHVSTYLSQRSEYYKRKGFEDQNTVALVERLAFYEILLEACVARLDAYENSSSPPDNSDN